MAKKQTAELRRRLLAYFPRECSIKHLRHGGFGREQTEAAVVTAAGTVLMREQANSLEQALRAMVERQEASVRRQG